GSTVNNGSHLPLGSSLYDVATLSDSGNPFTGSVTFTLWKAPFTNNDCTTGTVVSTESSVSVSGTSATSSATTALGAGAYAFTAQSAAGQEAHHKSPAGTACEPFTTDQGTPQLATTVKDGQSNTVNDANPAALGTSVHDTATLSGGTSGFSFDGTATVTYT